MRYSTKGKPIHRPLADRLWEKVDRSGECWIFLGATNSKGYGVLRSSVDAKQITSAAHRVAWIDASGPIPPGKWILHHCDNPPCVRPDHLYAGTPADNVRDRDSRGRNGMAKVTLAQVRELRARRRAGEKLADLAADYGLSVSQTCSITTGHDWKDAHDLRS